MREGYIRKEVSWLAKVYYQSVEHFCEQGVTPLPPTRGTGVARFFTNADLLALRIASELAAFGTPVNEVVLVTQPLRSFCESRHGRKVGAHKDLQVIPVIARIGVRLAVHKVSEGKLFELSIGLKDPQEPAITYRNFVFWNGSRILNVRTNAGEERYINAQGKVVDPTTVIALGELGKSAASHLTVDVSELARELMASVAQSMAEEKTLDRPEKG